MVLGGPRDDRSSRQVITFSLERRPRLGHSVPVSTRGKERKMLSATLGMLAMLPVVFGVAGWAMVSR
jgi:hypothetical protein